MFRNDGSSNIRGEEIEEFWALKDINFEVKKGETVAEPREKRGSFISLPFSLKQQQQPRDVALLLLWPL